MARRTPQGEVGPGSDPATLAAVSTRAELGALLTELRGRSGRSLRDLAAAIGSSASTLSGWCRAENLPFPSQLEVFRAMLRELGVEDPEPWVGALLRVRDATSAEGDERPPYLGLDSFGPDDADRFFGRDELVGAARARLQAVLEDPDRHDLLVVVGASGAGKSSLIQAGLVAWLRASGVRTVTCTPGDTPLPRLAEALAELADLDREVVRGQLAAAAPVAELGDAAPQGPGGPRRVLVVDQLEELFAPDAPPAEADRLLAALDELTRPGNPLGCAVIVALRLDFYPRLALTGRLRDALQDAQLLVGGMDTEQLRAAIVQPARAVGVQVDDALVEVLLREVAPRSALEGALEVGALPLLSHALLETWRRARRGRMTVDDYHAAGGIAGAIEHSAESVHAGLSDAQRRLVRQLLLRLVHVEEGAAATRRTATTDELQGLGDPDRVTELIERFVDARLVTAGADRYALAHEAVLGAWPRLRGWVEESREALRLHRRVAEATRLWVDSGRDPSALARGVLLEAMVEGRDHGSGQLALTTEEQAFLTASIERADAELRAERARTRRLRALVAVTTAAGLLAVVLAGVAATARTDALVARDEARSRQVALVAERLSETDPGLAAQLAVAAQTTASTESSRSAVLQAAAGARSARWLGDPGSTALVASPDGELIAVGNSAQGSVALLVGGGDRYERAATIELGDAELEVYALALSPDATQLVVGDTGPRVTRWDIRDPFAPVPVGEPLVGPEGPVQGLAITPDGGELAAVGLGDGVFRWALGDPVTPRPVLPADEITWSAAYHPTDPVVAAGLDDGRVLVWELGDEPVVRAELDVGDSSVLTVAFAPDGESLVAGTRAGEVQVWDLTEPAAPEPVELDEAGFDSWVNAAAFSLDGRWLVAGSSDGNVRIWSAGDGRPVTTLPHPAAITAVGFAADDAQLWTAAVDGTARQWPLRTALPAHVDGRIWGLDPAPDGRDLAAFAGGVTALFPADARHLGREPLAVIAAADDLVFSGAGGRSPDGRLLAQGTLSGEVVLTDLADRSAPVELGPPLTGSEALVEDVAFSADGRLLAAGGADTDVRLWDLADPADPPLVAVLDDPGELVLGLAFSPQGRLLAVGSADNRVTLFDLEDPARPVTLAVLDDFDSEVYAVAFSPDSRVLAAAGSDAEVVRFDLGVPDDPQPLGAALTGPTGRIFDLDHSPDGGLLAAAVVDGTAWVWDLQAGALPERLAVLSASTSPSYALSFTPDGGGLVTAGADGQVRRYDLDVEAALVALCASAGDAVTEVEWERAVPGREYRLPCAGVADGDGGGDGDGDGDGREGRDEELPAGG